MASKGDGTDHKQEEEIKLPDMESKDNVDMVKKSRRISFGAVNTILYDRPEPIEDPKEEAPKEDEKEVAERRQWLMDFMKMDLGLRPNPEQLLTTLDLDGVADYIKSGKCSNIITMAGAGISTSAGIPDFRSPGTGLYDNLQKYNLPHPQSVFDIGYFWKHPEPFFQLAKDLWPGVFKPTPCHYFIKMLADKGVLLRHYTQNIDTLESHAGLDPDKLVEAHGSFRTAHCLICEKEYSQDFIQEKVFAEEIPKCTEEGCEDGIVKPDIVFFGEPLPERFRQCSVEDFGKCDLLIVMGTSLVVQPFASLTNRVKHETPRLYINMEKTGAGPSNPITMLMFGGGFKFDDEKNYRDVFWQGTCDDGCYLLAEKLGWKEELTKIVEEEHAKIDESSKILKSKIKQPKCEEETEKAPGSTTVDQSSHLQPEKDATLAEISTSESEKKLSSVTKNSSLGTKPKTKKS